jgi:membrane fusion protein (multidrug efflux system)
MWVYFNVPEAEYLNYREHSKQDSVMRVRLLMANQEVFEYPGKVETIEADFNNETGNIAFRATFPNPKGLLRHGETGNVLATQMLKNALIIPQKSTFEVLEKKYVFVVDKDNIVRQKEITISAELPDLYIVSSGITENDRIMLEGIRKVRNEDKIEEYKYEDPKTVLPRLKVYVE